jgi:serine/threonine-protein kinase
MVLVPAGPFKYGQDKETANLPAYYIDRTEVANRAYAAFCTATSRPLPQDFPSDKPDFPVVNVTIQDAKDFAKWAGERLPTGREWEKAARGTDGRTYPWGEQADPSKASLGPDGTLHPVTDFAAGASPFKTLQMIGNAWEFTDERGTPSDGLLKHFTADLKMQPPPTFDDPWYLVRGGSFKSELRPELMWDHSTIPLLWKDPNIGFRCAKDAQ